MIEEPPVLKIKRDRRRPTKEQSLAFQGVPTGFVVDAMHGGNGLAAEISPFFGSATQQIAGPALTAENGPGDVLATLAAIHLLEPGDVLLAGVSGHQGCAAVGDRVCGMARNAGAVAIVTDGPARDAQGIEAEGLALWCTGLTPETPASSGPGRIGLPMQFGGLRVDTGDMVIADRDGAAVVPFDQIDAVIERLAVVMAIEAARDAEVADGFRHPKSALLDSTAVEWV